MTAFRRSNSTDLRDIADSIVQHLDRVSAEKAKSGHDVSDQPRVPAGNGDESGRWTKEGDAAPADMEEITIHGRPPLTDDQIAAIIFNETRALHGPDLHKARVDMAATIINADTETGGNRAKRYKTAPDRITGNISPDEQRALQDIKSAVAEARALEDSNEDPTHYATNFDLPKEVNEAELAQNPEDSSYALRTQYRTFWDSNEHIPKSIRIYNNPAANKHRPK